MLRLFDLTWPGFGPSPDGTSDSRLDSIVLYCDLCTESLCRSGDSRYRGCEPFLSLTTEYPITISASVYIDAQIWYKK